MVSSNPEVVGSGLPRAYQRPCVLILLGEGSAHGYDLLEQLRGIGLISVDAGGLYRSLRSMEEDGLVSSRWEPSPAGPPRRSYELSEKGQLALASAVRDLTEVRDLLSRLVERFHASPRTATEP